MTAGQIADPLSAERHEARRGTATRRSDAFFGPGFEAVAERPVVTPFEAKLLPLALSGANQMLQAPGAAHNRRAAFGAALVALLPELVLALPRDRQTSELILNRFSHNFLNDPAPMCPTEPFVAVPGTQRPVGLPGVQ